MKAKKKAAPKNNNSRASKPASRARGANRNGRTKDSQERDNPQSEHSRKSRNRQSRTAETVNTVDEDAAQKKDKKKVTMEQEKAMLAFVDATVALGHQAIVDEFRILIANCLPDANKCTAFVLHKDKNRCEKTLLLDETRVVLQPTTTVQHDYIHASRVKLPQMDRNVIVTQLPMGEFVEDFWRMVFQENCCLIVVLCQPMESVENFAELVPAGSGEYKYFGSMFINNKKVEKPDGKEKGDKHNAQKHTSTMTYTVEVLPDGCSNSIICKVFFHLGWPPMGCPKSRITPMRFAIEALDPKLVGSVCLVSLDGTGRAGCQAVVLAAINLLEQGVTPSICDLTLSIRKQRAFAVENSIQYASIFNSVLHFIALRVSSAKERVDGFQKRWETLTSW